MLLSSGMTIALLNAARHEERQGINCLETLLLVVWNIWRRGEAPLSSRDCGTSSGLFWPPQGLLQGGFGVGTAARPSVLLSSGETSWPPERAAIAAAFLPADASMVHFKKFWILLAARPRIAPGEPGCPGGLRHHPSKHAPSEVPPRAPALRPTY